MTGSLQAMNDVLEGQILRGISEGVFPSAAAAASMGDEPVTLFESSPERVYDIASLTKVFVATLTHRLRLLGRLDIDSPIGSLWPEVISEPVAHETIRSLLTHRAGLEAWRPLYKEAGRERIVRAAAQSGTDAPRPTYSDLGFILLGALLERLTGQALPDLLAREVLEPLALGSVRFGPVPADLTLPTGRCEWRNRIVHGEVNDENAAAMGGVAGHAGLFANVCDVWAMGRAMLASVRGAGGILPPEMAQDVVTPPAVGTHALGWDTRKPSSSSSGSLMGPRTFGHLGFTGCSLWIDPDVGLVVALLSNRVHPTRENLAIREFRPRFHDAVALAARRGSMQ